MAEKCHVLVVEDDRNISKLIRYNLEREGYVCTTVITGEEAFKVLDVNAVDLILLDIMLPKMDGFETCRRIRQDRAAAHIPIIMLTARGEEVDRIVGLELGADDYMVKPFSPRELLLRIKAVLKRGQAVDPEKDIVTADKIVMDIPRHLVKVNGKKIDLSPMEFKLLHLLIKRKGRVQSRDVLLDDVWGITADVTTRTVDTHVKLLRQKIGKHADIIQTIRGIGYKISDGE